MERKRVNNLSKELIKTIQIQKSEDTLHAEK